MAWNHGSPCLLLAGGVRRAFRMFLTSQKVVGDEVGEGFRVGVVGLMSNQWQDNALGVFQSGLEFVVVGASDDSVFVALDQQDRGFDGWEDGAQVQFGHDI